MVAKEAKEAYEKVLRLLGDNRTYSGDLIEVGILRSLKLGVGDLSTVVPEITSKEFTSLNEYRSRGEAIVFGFLEDGRGFNPEYLLGLTKDRLVACYGGNTLGVGKPEKVKEALESLIALEKEAHPKRVAEYESDLAKGVYDRFGKGTKQAAKITMCTSMVPDYEARLVRLNELVGGEKNGEL